MKIKKNKKADPSDYGSFLLVKLNLKYFSKGFFML